MTIKYQWELQWNINENSKQILMRIAMTMLTTIVTLNMENSAVVVNSVEGKSQCALSNVNAVHRESGEIQWCCKKIWKYKDLTLFFVQLYFETLEVRDF